MRLIVGICIASWMAAAAASAQLSRTVDAGDGLYLHQGMGGVSIHDPSGGEEPFELPAGVDFKQLARIGDGWLAAGTRPTERGSDLLLLAKTAGEVAVVPSPEATAAALRGGPVPVTEKGRLLGLAWLEGEAIESLEVRAARWDGKGWEKPIVVGPAGPGTQIALAATVLADGDWLLLWSGFDGTDDEILWSLRRGGRWSAPAPLHPGNDMPDITPAVIATGHGAIAAWSWLDGSDYRLRIARFGGDAWELSDFLGGRGSLFPGFGARGEGALLLYFTEATRSWTVLELDGGGRIGRRAEVSDETGLRPLILEVNRSGVTLEWPGSDPKQPRRQALVEWREAE